MARKGLLITLDAEEGALIGLTCNEAVVMSIAGSKMFDFNGEACAISFVGDGASRRAGDCSSEVFIGASISLQDDSTVASFQLTRLGEILSASLKVKGEDAWPGWPGS